jgi:hypothetical protein
VVRNVEFPCNLVIWLPPGDGGGEFWAIVRLNGDGETEVGNNFLDQDGDNCGGPFI